MKEIIISDLLGKQIENMHEYNLDKIISSCIFKEYVRIYKYDNIYKVYFDFTHILNVILDIEKYYLTVNDNNLYPGFKKEKIYICEFDEVYLKNVIYFLEKYGVNYCIIDEKNDIAAYKNFKNENSYNSMLSIRFSNNIDESLNQIEQDRYKIRNGVPRIKIGSIVEIKDLNEEEILKVCISSQYPVYDIYGRINLTYEKISQVDVMPISLSSKLGNALINRFEGDIINYNGEDDNMCTYSILKVINEENIEKIDIN